MIEKKNVRKGHGQIASHTSSTMLGLDWNPIQVVDLFRLDIFSTVVKQNLFYFYFQKLVVGVVGVYFLST